MTLNLRPYRTLRQTFSEDFSKSAFQTHCGDDAIVGKFGVIIQLEDGSFDVWFVYPDGSPLSERKLGAIEKNIPEEWGFTRLTGEGYTQGKGEEFVRIIAPVVGVKKKRQMTAEQKAAQAARLAQHRESCQT